jgi:hypothetical protein
MKSMLEFQAQQQQQQQLQLTGFKHSPGSPKTSARVVPEGLPVSPLTLNAKKRCGWITSQSGEYVSFYSLHHISPLCLFFRFLA